MQTCQNKYHKDLEKQEGLRDCSVLVTIPPLWHVAQWVSRAPPHHTLPAFLNLDGRKIYSDQKLRVIRQCIGKFVSFRSARSADSARNFRILIWSSNLWMWGLITWLPRKRWIQSAVIKWPTIKGLYTLSVFWFNFDEIHRKCVCWNNN